MKRITPLAEALATGTLVLDADGIEADIGGLDALRYDSGVIDVSDLLSNGWTGKAYMWRTGWGVTVRLDSLSSAGSTSGAFLTLPPGYAPRPVPGEPFRARFDLHTAAGTFRRGASNSATLTLYGYGASEVLFGEVHLTTADPIPTS